MSRQVGILGGGQLARMLALAGHPLGLEFTVLDPAADACAAALARQLVADYDDPEALATLSGSCDVVTFDFENVPAEALIRLAERLPVRPGAAILADSQDRVREKLAAAALGIAVGPWQAVDDAAGLDAAIAEIGLPMVLKTRRFGYDGKGQVRIDADGTGLAAARALLSGQPCIAEAWIPFTAECSSIATRSSEGDVVCYPLTRNRHHGGILRASLAGIDPPMDLAAQAESGIRALLTHYQYVGTLAVEWFVVQGRLSFNEMAPRVHNSGHWSIEGALCSQFENHLRAVCGLPLGSSALRRPSLMLNWIGQLPDPARYLTVPDLHWHDYDKPPRPGRKVGHATLLGEAEELRGQVESWLGDEDDAEARLALDAARQLLQDAAG